MLKTNAFFWQKITLVCGGHDGKNYLQTCEFLDCAANKWTFAAPLLTARSLAAVASYNDKFYIFGGNYDKDYNKLDTAEEYNYEANKWTLLPIRLSKPKSQLAAACANGRIYICGGEVAFGSCINDVDCYDPDKACLTSVASLPEARGGAAAVGLAVSSAVIEQLFK